MVFFSVSRYPKFLLLGPTMNHRTFAFVLSAVIMFMVCASQSAHAQMSPGIGYEASLSTISHDVSGTVSILDANTLLVEDFVFDGGGISIFFYLGTSENTFASGLAIGPELLGTVYDGTQAPFTIDLPAGMTVDGYNAVSVWCVAAGVSFGHGTFSAPVLLGDVNGNGMVEFADIAPFITHLQSDTFNAQADMNRDGSVTFEDIAPFIAALAMQ